MSGLAAGIVSVKKPKQLAAEKCCLSGPPVPAHRADRLGRIFCASGAKPFRPQRGPRTVTLLRLRPLFTCQRTLRHHWRGPAFYPRSGVTCKGLPGKKSNRLQMVYETAHETVSFGPEEPLTAVMGPRAPRTTRVEPGQDTHRRHTKINGVGWFGVPMAPGSAVRPAAGWAGGERLWPADASPSTTSRSEEIPPC